MEETIGKVVWQAILSLIETRINDGSLAHGFPSHCEDGNEIVGTDEKTVWTTVRAEIGDLANDDTYSKPSPNSLPGTPAILDFVEFAARHVAQPTRARRHDFLKHYHLELDREEGLRKFVEEVNRLFSRNRLAYKLTNVGVIERTVPAPMAKLLKRTGFCTGDHDLDDLLDTAIKRFLLPKPEARQDALEKLWDAFERLKTIEGPGKKAGADTLIDNAIAGDAAVFHSIVTEEFRAMTKIGNELRIRHSEVGKEQVGDNGEKDYLFMRLFSLIWLVLKGTGRLSEVRDDDADNDDETPFRVG